MRKLALLGTIAGSLFLVTGAQAKSRLTIRQAKVAITRWVAEDRPTSVTFLRCRHQGRRGTVGCWVTEHNIPVLLTDNGAPVTGDLSYWGTVTLRRGHIVMTSGPFLRG